MNHKNETDSSRDPSPTLDNGVTESEDEPSTSTSRTATRVQPRRTYASATASSSRSSQTPSNAPSTRRTSRGSGDDNPTPSTSKMSFLTTNCVMDGPLGRKLNSAQQTVIQLSSGAPIMTSSISNSTSDQRLPTPTSSPEKEVSPRRGTKRAAANGVSKARWEEKTSDFLCTICLDTFQEPHITRCGHTFCHPCILSCLENSPRCPSCGANVLRDDLVPNFSLNQLVAKNRMMEERIKEDAKMAKEAEQDNEDAKGDAIREILSCKKFDKMNITEVETLIQLLSRKHEVLSLDSEAERLGLMKFFLREMRNAKLNSRVELERELEIIAKDMEFVEQAAFQNGQSQLEMSPPLPPVETSTNCLPAPAPPQIFAPDRSPGPSIAERRMKLLAHFDELSKVYLDSRANELCLGSEPDENYVCGFGKVLSRITRFSNLRPMATLSYSADLLSSSNIVSSIEFDKDNEFFAIAGVTKKIKLFEYANVIGSSVDIHCPNAELACTAKISCVAWSSYYKNRLASSDYDGCVNLWDAATSNKIRELSEHEKRVWSVDWSHGDPRLLASGSDDTKVKLWSTSLERCIADIEAQANVCCVKFSPDHTYELAFGCADHCVHYYDLRHPKHALGIYYGHLKAVSYVKFASSNELVSASTDSRLRLWDVQKTSCTREFKGHINEKNFVGLATDGNFIACGSENNSLYIYYKHLTEPLFTYKFDNHRNILDRPSRVDESTEFVSAVAWKKDSDILLAANSQGSIKVLQLA